MAGVLSTAFRATQSKTWCKLSHLQPHQSQWLTPLSPLPSQGVPPAPWLRSLAGERALSTEGLIYCFLFTACRHLNAAAAPCRVPAGGSTPAPPPLWQVQRARKRQGSQQRWQPLDPAAANRAAAGRRVATHGCSHSRYGRAGMAGRGATTVIHPPDSGQPREQTGGLAWAAWPEPG